MNLPDYLAPAPKFDFDAHGFEFPVRVKTFSEGRQWRAPCKCGEVGTIPQTEVILARDGFEPFERWMVDHCQKRLEEEKIRAKWGPNYPGVLSGEKDLV